MRPSYDDFDDFEFDDSELMKRMLREQNREQRRLASRRYHGPGSRRRSRSYSDYSDYDEFDGVEEYEEFDDFEEYDDDEFDEYAGIGTDR
jgi:hypothetical protein